MAELLVLIGVAMTCGFIAALITAKNGRNAKTWFYIGLLLGPVGIIIVLLIGTGIRCPECQGSVMPGARRCKNCGAELVAAEPEPAKTPPAKTAPQSDRERHQEMLRKFHEARGEKSPMQGSGSQAP